ncbi:MAG: hypothetical protein OCD76_02210 [Reichenbachiella sp.]
MRRAFLTTVLLVISAFNFILAQEVKESYDLKIGGAIRANYLVKSWDEQQKKKGGEMAFDMMRFDVDANYNNVIVSGQIRFYSQSFGGVLIHHAYMGYKFGENAQIQIGIHQVPFGIQTYASNNWFFNINYYVGLEDDYDMGLKYIYEKDKLELHLAFYKNSEFPAGDFSRYSYDITGTQNEINQFNGKVSYDIGKAVLGASAQLGQLEEVATGDIGHHSAYAIHAHSKLGKLNLKLQASYYNISPRGEEKDVVSMSAYGAEYSVSTHALVYTLGVMYSVPLNRGPLKSLDFYNDFGLIDKQVSGHTNSMMNVTGTGVNMGKLYTYVDWAWGYNHAWLGPEWTDAFAAGDVEAKWHARFNINFGYYF